MLNGWISHLDVVGLPSSMYVECSVRKRAWEWAVAVNKYFHQCRRLRVRYTLYTQLSSFLNDVYVAQMFVHLSAPPGVV